MKITIQPCEFAPTVATDYILSELPEGYIEEVFEAVANEAKTRYMKWKEAGEHMQPAEGEIGDTWCWVHVFPTKFNSLSGGITVDRKQQIIRISIDNTPQGDDELDPNHEHWKVPHPGQWLQAAEMLRCIMQARHRIVA